LKVLWKMASMARGSGWLWSNPWTEECQRAETDLLNSANWGEQKTWKAVDVPVEVNGVSHHIHTIESSMVDGKEAPLFPIVLWHGFGQSAASWWQNLPGLTRAHKAPVYACDWLGVGLSSRPEWVNGDCPIKTEAMFVESMEQWRKHQVS
jgi:pimeloyl-ACP methyl ester carboxylesterase